MSYELLLINARRPNKSELSFSLSGASLGNNCNTAASNPCLDSNAVCNGSPTTCSCAGGYSNVNGVCSQDTSSSSCKYIICFGFYMTQTLSRS
jgi:hypothetical protein